MLHKVATQKPTPLSDRQRRIYNFLREHPVGVLSTITPSRNPHGTVVYYTIDKNFMVHFLTKKGTRKYDNLKHNSHGMLTVFDPLTQATAQVTGVAVECEGDIRIHSVVMGILKGALRTSVSGVPPIAKLEAGEFTVFQIEPVQIRMATYDRLDSGRYEDLFESIESFNLKEGV